MRLGSLTSIKARTHWISPGSGAHPRGDARRTRSQFHRSSVVKVRCPASPPASAPWRSPIAKPAPPGSAGPGGGAGENRTPDFRLAKAALSQLSYGPAPWPHRMVGHSGLEPETSVLSGLRSNQLS